MAIWHKHITVGRFHDTSLLCLFYYEQTDPCKHLAPQMEDVYSMLIWHQLIQLIFINLSNIPISTGPDTISSENAISGPQFQQNHSYIFQRLSPSSFAASMPKYHNANRTVNCGCEALPPKPKGMDGASSKWPLLSKRRNTTSSRSVRRNP